MSLQELKTEAETLSRDERFALEAWLRELRLKDSNEEQRELATLNARMDDGEKVPWAELREIHEDLKAKGL